MAPLTADRRHLPDGWRWVKLGEVCDFIGGNTLPEPDTANNEQVFCLKVSDLSGEFSDGRYIGGSLSYTSRSKAGKQILSQGGIVFPKRGGAIATNKKRQLIINACLDPNLMGVQPSTEDVMSDYLFWWFESWDLSSIQSGNTVPQLNQQDLSPLEFPLPPLAEQRRVAKVLDKQMAAVENARAAAQARLEAVTALPDAFARNTLRGGSRHTHLLGDCLIEVKNGVGAAWSNYPVLGATRDGLAPAKESVGKAPERYKLVDPVTVFYNPMRILLGSIAMVDEGDATGITSPDYVVVKGQPGVLDTRWFYYWFRSSQGAQLIDSLSRGAVRERILFNRLSAGKIEIPDYETQLYASARMRQVKPIAESISKELAAINALPAALLRRAFNGEI